MFPSYGEVKLPNFFGIDKQTQKSKILEEKQNLSLIHIKLYVLGSFIKPASACIGNILYS